MTEKDLQRAVRQMFHNHQYVLVNSFVFNWESDFFSITKNGTVYEVEMKISRADFREDFKKDKHLLFKDQLAKKSHHIYRKDGRGVWDKARVIAQYIDPGLEWDYPKGYHKCRWNDYVSGYGGYRFYPRVKDILAPCTAIEIKPMDSILCPNRFYYACPPGIIPVEELPPYAGLIHVENDSGIMVKQAPFMHKRPMLREKLAMILLDKFWYLSQEMRYHLQRHNINFKDCSTAEKNVNYD